MAAKRTSAEVMVRAAGLKQCKRCDQWQPEAGFNKHPYTVDGLNPLCRDCVNNYNRIYKLRTRYNMTQDQYDRILEDQNGVCAICEKLETRAGRYNLVIDHDHACCSGEFSCGECVRGLLCADCNTALGLFRDDTNSLQRASAYLERAL